MSALAFIAIGSNLGNRIENCKNAIEQISKLKGTCILKQSNFYKYPALTLNNEPQPEFINGVIKISTELNPDHLLNNLKLIEAKAGRRLNDKKWAPRVIDIDIVFYDNLIANVNSLNIPHLEAHKRHFVLKPMCDIEPDFIHPKFGISISKLLNNLEKENNK